MRHAAELGLRRQIPEDHVTPAWLVQHAAVAGDWFKLRPAGNSSLELRHGGKMRRVVDVSTDAVVTDQLRKSVARGHLLPQLRSWSWIVRRREWHARRSQSKISDQVGA